MKSVLSINDIKIGDKVTPIRKMGSIADLDTCDQFNAARAIKQSFLYVGVLYGEQGVGLVALDPGRVVDEDEVAVAPAYYAPSDLVAYVVPATNPCICPKTAELVLTQYEELLDKRYDFDSFEKNGSIEVLGDVLETLIDTRVPTVNFSKEIPDINFPALNEKIAQVDFTQMFKGIDAKALVMLAEPKQKAEQSKPVTLDSRAFDLLYAGIEILAATTFTYTPKMILEDFLDQVKRLPDEIFRDSA